MNCPNCGQPTKPRAAFCASCGALLDVDPSAAPAVPPVPQPVPQPAPEWRPQAPPPAVPPGSYGGYGYAPEERRRNRTSSIAIISVAVVVAVLGLALIVAVLVTRNGDKATAGVSTSLRPTTTLAPGAAVVTPTSEGSTDRSYSTPEEAVNAELPQGWVHKMAKEAPDEVVYWGGPPNSEWVTAYTVTKTSRGWRVSRSGPVDQAPSATSPEPGDEAAKMVAAFITAVKENRADDAHALTIDPFAQDPASAQYSNGELTGFRIDKTRAADNGAFWVTATEEWTYGTETWRYHVVPTEAGLRIDQLTGT